MTTPTTSVTDSIRVRLLNDLTEDERRSLVRRSAVPDPDVRAKAGEICRAISQEGDAALRTAGAAYGGGRPETRVPQGEIDAALASVEPTILDSLKESISAVRRHHEAQKPKDHTHETFPGVRIERRWSPLGRIGAYVPGGKAAYSSSLVMTVVPAQVAGVTDIAVATPCDEHQQLNPVLLAVAGLLGITEIHAMGGAQAVAAFAYGTETIDPVDKIVGPGSVWVTAAKLEVLGACAIDIPAGPSEVLVVADESANPRFVAIDLLCQAEHGPDSPAILVTSDATLPGRVLAQIEKFLPSLPRRDILASGLAAHGDFLVVDSIGEAIAFANDYASEHVTVLTNNPAQDAELILNAGSVFVGQWSPESAGDYATGANHVLPTGGLARSYGPLSVDDFGSWRQVQSLTRDGLATIRSTIEGLATAEGLDAHRLAAAVRFEDENSENERDA